MDLPAVIVILIIAILLFVSIYSITLYNRIILSQNNTFKKFKPIDTSIKKYISIIKELNSVVKDPNLSEELSLLSEKLLKADNNNKKILVLKDANYTINRVFELYNNKKIDKLKEEYNKYNNKIEYAEGIYNEKVKEYNHLLKEFPYSIVTKILSIEKINTIDGD